MQPYSENRSKMLIIVVATVSLLALYCRPAHCQQKNHEIPLPYKLTSLYNRPSLSPDHMPEAIQPKYYRQKYHVMQYAPLHSNNGDITLFRHMTAVNNIPRGISKNHESKLTHLEPRKLPLNNLDSAFYTPFILGHNVELLQSVSRSPGHNTAYRSYPEDSDKRHNKVNFLRQYILSQVPSEQTERTYPSTETLETSTVLPTTVFALQLYKDKQNNRTETYSLLNGDSMSLEKIQPHLLHAKSHRLLLNVARHLNSGQ